jgi:hypothetical protein
MRPCTSRLRACGEFVSLASVKVRLAHPRIQELALSLEPGRTVIVGRAAPEVDLELNWDAHVSRWHARLWVEDGRLCVQDLGSRNGTWRGAERLLDAAYLEVGESVRIGDTIVTAADMVASPGEHFDDEATQPGDTRSPLSVSVADLRLGSTDIVAPRVPPDAATVPSIPSGALLGAETARPAPALRPPSQVAPPPFAPPPPSHHAAPRMLTPTPVAGYAAPHAASFAPAPHAASFAAASFAPPTPVAGYAAPPAASFAPAPPAASFAPAPPAASFVATRSYAHDLTASSALAGGAAASPPAVSPPPALATAPRATLRGPAGMFVTADRLDVRCGGAAEVRALWTEHLSRGGLFVETSDLRPTGTRVEVSLSTPDGAVSFSGLVVHAAPLSGAGPAGLGLQLADLPPQTKQAIVAYAEGQAPVLATRRPAEAEADTADVDAAATRARRLLEQLGSSDVYKVLEIAPDATDAALKERIATVARGMSSAAQHASPQKAARIEQAVLALGRLSQSLGDPLRRLEHDLSRGHVRADARIAAAQAGTGPSIAELRLVWQKVAPDKVTRATQLTREALTARQRGDLEGAIRQARAALADNPFSDELRSTVADWTKSAQQGDEPLPRSPTTRGRR